MSVQQLYRPKELNARQAKWIGQIVLVCPITFPFPNAFAAAMARVIPLFLIFGSHIKRLVSTVPTRATLQAQFIRAEQSHGLHQARRQGAAALSSLPYQKFSQSQSARPRLRFQVALPNNFYVLPWQPKALDITASSSHTARKRSPSQTLSRAKGCIVQFCDTGQR